MDPDRRDPLIGDGASLCVFIGCPECGLPCRPAAMTHSWSDLIPMACRNSECSAGIWHVRKDEIPDLVRQSLVFGYAQEMAALDRQGLNHGKGQP
jgi:hypothetical protein